MVLIWPMSGMGQSMEDPERLCGFFILFYFYLIAFPLKESKMRHVSGKVALEAKRLTPACRAADFIHMYRGMPADAGKRCGHVSRDVGGCRKTVQDMYRRMPADAAGRLSYGLKCGEALGMRERLQRFMWGRYGTDRLNQVLLICAFLSLLISFLGGWIFYLLATVLMGYAYFRMFSRNVNKRSLENQKYLKQEMKVRGFFGKMKRDMAQRKEYHIYKCPGCGQKLRVPRGKGRIAISCRKCGNEFIKKS